MNITFLVGNGFDIACGLHTSYRDFYDWLFAHQSSDIRVERLKLSLKDDISENKNDWADFELWLGHYTGHFNDSLTVEFLDSYDSINNAMIEFVSEERNKYSNSFKSPELINELRNTLVNFTEELDPESKNQIDSILNARPDNAVAQFITFNYTNCIDLTVDELSKEPLLEQVTRNGTRRFLVKKDVIHVHGSLSQYPIIGVSEEKYVENREMLSNAEVSEALIKEKSVHSVGQFWYRDARNSLESSQIICIFGSSLGASDSLWWKAIVSWLKGSSSRHLIVFRHTDHVIGQRSIIQRNRELRKVHELLLRHSELKPQERDEIASRIHVVFNSKKMLQVAFEPM